MKIDHIGSIGVDLKLSIDDLIWEIHKLREEVDRLKKFVNLPEKNKK